VDEIEVRKGPGGKTAFIKGSRTCVSDIARLFQITQEELVVERICESMPYLEPAQVRAAIAWWHDHEQDVEQEIEEERELLAKVSAK
jgi:uncharacterized protein (DUF433 family)